MKICIFGSAPRKGVGGCFPTDADINHALFEMCGQIQSKLTTLISGNALGADRCGERWATNAGLDIKRYPADWPKHGIEAGRIRNEFMARLLTPDDIAIGFWDGRSTGTSNMATWCDVLRIPHRVVLWKPSEQMKIL